MEGSAVSRRPPANELRQHRYTGFSPRGRPGGGPATFVGDERQTTTASRRPARGRGAGRAPRLCGQSRWWRHSGAPGAGKRNGG